MAFFPEFLYKLSDRDQEVTWLDPVVVHSDVSAAVAVIQSAVYTVPGDRMLILQNVSMLANPAAGRAVIDLNFALQPPPPETTTYRVVQEFWTVAADVNRGLNWSGSILVPPLWRVSAIAVIDGAAGGQIVHDIFGILIPKGNVQRV